MKMRLSILIVMVLVLQLIFTGCATHKNVIAGSRLSYVSEGMGEKQVGSIMGKPNDRSQKKLFFRYIIWSPLHAIPYIGRGLVAFFNPDFLETCFYYKGEGRIYFRRPFGEVDDRVHRVVGDKEEDGFK